MMSKAPCWDQSEARISSWVREHVHIDTPVVVGTIKDGRPRYDRARVTQLGRGKFQITLMTDGAPFKGAQAFYYTGRSCRNPRGATRLVIPTVAVLKACDVCMQNGGFLLGEPNTYTFSFR